VADKTDATYYNYAIAAAACSDEIVTRFWAPVGDDFPSVLEDQIPAFEADVSSKSVYEDREPQNTVYAVWIGTNDIGYHGFLTDKQVAGTTLSSLVERMWRVFDRVYAAGGRRFVLMNQMPLDVSPMYAPPSQGGRGDSIYWTDYSSYNMTEYQHKAQQYATSVNTISDQGAAFHTIVQNRWPGAQVTILDAHSIMMDIYNHPSEYLSSPANGTGFYHVCDVDDPSNCRDSAEPASSFLWYDELHPTERVSSIIADEFIRAVNGKSEYAATYESRRC
jgi:phospholipase/lecithinase/hemolysin